MPPVIAAVVAIASTAIAGTTIGAIVANALIGAVISMGIGALSGALGKKPSASMSGFRSGSLIKIQQSAVETHKICYGRSRISGPLVYSTSTAAAGVKNNLLYMVIALVAHRIHSFENIYINDKKAVFGAEDTVTNMYRSSESTPRVKVVRKNGLDNQEFISAGGSEWDDKHRLQGIAYLRTRLIFDAGAFPNGVPQFSADIKGRYLYDPRVTPIDVVSEDINGVITTDGAHGLAVNDPVWVVSDDDDTDGEYVVDAVPSSTTLKLRTVFNETVTLELTSADKISLMAWSDNWALVCRDYISNPIWGLGHKRSEIDDDSVIAAANISDEDVTLPDETTEKRYTINGIVDTADQPIDILNHFKDSGAGDLVYIQGKWFFHAGAYATPVATIDESWLAGELEVVARPPRNQIFNAVKGVYRDREKNWQATDFPAVTNALYESQDGGERIFTDMDLPFTDSVHASQRIAKIRLERHRQGTVVKYPCNWKAMQVAPADRVWVTNDQLGWSSKVFKVIDWEFTITSGILLTLQEDAAGVYDWNAGEETTVDLAPDTNLPNPWEVDPPGNPVITETLYETTDGSGVKTKVLVTWAESPTAFVNKYILEYRLVGATDWITAGTPYNNELTIYDMAPGDYEFRNFAVTMMDAISEEYGLTVAEVMGLTAAPSPVTNFTVNPISNQAHLSWDQHPDLDVRNGGWIYLRWSPDVEDVLWSDCIPISDALPGITTSAVVPLRDGTYMVKAKDSGRRESETAASLIVKLVNITNLNTVATWDQHPTFPGEKTGLIVDTDDDTLMLDGGGLFDDMTGDFDDAGGNFDAGGGIGFETEGEYVFEDGSGNDWFDNGAALNVQIAGHISAFTYDASETFDESDGLFDDREGLFDGADRANIDVRFWIRTTSTDPESIDREADPEGWEAIWGEWRWFLVTNINERYYQIKATVESQISSNNIKIAELSHTADIPERPEVFLNTAITTMGTAIVYDLPYYTKPEVGGVIQGPTSGDTLEVTHTTSGGKYTGATLRVLNGGSPANRTMDVYVKGH